MPPANNKCAPNAEAKKKKAPVPVNKGKTPMDVDDLVVVDEKKSTSRNGVLQGVQIMNKINEIDQKLNSMDSKLAAKQVCKCFKHSV